LQAVPGGLEHSNFLEIQESPHAFPLTHIFLQLETGFISDASTAICSFESSEISEISSS
jgi:hypothetical protein